MTQRTFKTKLTKAFKNHSLMKDRDKHTINELLYVLEHDEEFKGMDFNITIVKLEGGCICMPSLDVFVATSVRAMWFEDKKVEFEVDEWNILEDTVIKTNCITIYESEGV